MPDASARLARLYNRFDGPVPKHLLEAALSGKSQHRIAVDRARASVRFYEERRDNALTRWEAFNRTDRVDPDRRLDLIDDLLAANAAYMQALVAWSKALDREAKVLAPVATTAEAAE